MINAQTEIGLSWTVVNEERRQVRTPLDAHAHGRQVERDDLEGIDGRGRPLAAQLDRRPETVTVEGYPSSGISSYHRPNDGVEEA